VNSCAQRFQALSRDEYEERYHAHRGYAKKSCELKSWTATSQALCDLEGAPTVVVRHSRPR